MGSFAISTTSTNDITGRIEWSESNVSIANNTSDLNVKLIYRMNASKYATLGSGYFKVTVNGVAYENNHYVSFASGTHEYTVIDHTFTITHDANGAKSVSIVLNNGYVAGTTGLSASSGSGTATLTTIARASQPSTTNGTFGSAITINTNRASSSFTHTLTMTMGSHSETKTGVGASLSWTIPASWADTIPTATSNTLSISCVTYNGSTNIGTKTTSCTATIPDSWKPSVSISKTLTNGGDSSQVIVSVTTVNLSASGSASTGTSISSYSWSGGAVSGTGASKTHSPSSAGTYTYTVTVTDRRGRTGSASTTATAESGVSSVSCVSSLEFGWNLPVTITRKKSSFTHDVRWFINSSYDSHLDNQGTSATCPVPASWASSVPSSSSINMTVRVTTKNGSTSLGYVDKTVLLVVPSSWVPAFTLSAEAVSAFNSQYLKGVSKVKLIASSVSPSTGSQIASYSFTGNNVNKTASSTATSYSVTSDLLSVVGSNTYTVKVTDKRGRVTTKTTSITVTDYKVPTVGMSVGRYTSGGDSDSFGSYGRASVWGTYSAVTGNTWTLEVKYKKKTDSNYTSLNSWSNQTGTISKTTSLFAADVDSAYDVHVSLTDAVGKRATRLIALSTGKALIDLYKDKVVSFFSTASENVRALFSNPNTLLYSGADKTALNGYVYVPRNGSNDGLTSGWQQINRTNYIWVEDVRDTNRTPEWYMSMYGHAVVAEFKERYNIGITGTGTYCTLLTIVPWSDMSGGAPVQYAYLGDKSVYVRNATSLTTWGAWGGSVDNVGGGAWISGRDFAGLKKAVEVGVGNFYPFVSQKTKNGSWDIGSLGSDNDLCFSYVSDANYSAGTNAHSAVYFSENGDISNSNGGSFWHSVNSLDNMTYSTSSKSVSTGTKTALYTATLGARGTYLTVCDFDWGSSSSSVSILFIDVYDQNGTTVLSRISRGSMLNGGGQTLSLLGFDLRSGYKIVLSTRQDSGSTQTCRYRWSNMRLRIHY